MKQFVNGSEEQFRILDSDLSSGKKFKFSNMLLPNSCIPNRATIWFAKIDNTYIVCIDKGVSFSGPNMDFANFLEKGEAKFICLEDMMEFFYSLNPLFVDNEEPIDVLSESITERADESIAGNNDTLISEVDRNEIKEIINGDSHTKMIWPDEISMPLKRIVFGQDEAIDELSNKVVINQMRKKKKLLPIALMGPTGTGKTETAKNLAKIMTNLYGYKYGFIEIAGSEFVGEHMVNRFFGAPPGYVGHGEKTILEPVRKNPHHIIVIDEIEKADEKLLVGLMEAIDTGVLGMADNSKPIDLNNCILLFTSNIPIDMEFYSNSSRFKKAEICRDAFTKHCGRPEISGKIGNFIAYNPLGVDAKINIVTKFMREELENYELELCHVDKYLLADFLKNESQYGARAIRNLVSESLGYCLLANRNLEDLKGSKVLLKGSIDMIEFEFV